MRQCTSPPQLRPPASGVCSGLGSQREDLDLHFQQITGCPHFGAGAGLGVILDLVPASLNRMANDISLEQHRRAAAQRSAVQGTGRRAGSQGPLRGDYCLSITPGMLSSCSPGRSVFPGAGAWRPGCLFPTPESAPQTPGGKGFVFLRAYRAAGQQRPVPGTRGRPCTAEPTRVQQVSP